MLLADSNAVLVEGRVLAQHQAALGLVRQMAQDPEVSQISWLDLACGRGQILSNIEHVIPKRRRNKIKYVGFDISREYALETENRARGLFPDVRVEICDLGRFESYLGSSDVFDLVTMTNTAHEISPRVLGETFVSALCRTSLDGCFYMYDMEKLPDPELGAIPWAGAEIERIFHNILRVAGADEASLPDIAVWPHKSCTCWNLQLHRSHLQVENLNGHKETMIEAATNVIRGALEEKLVALHSMLSSICRYGPETLEESQNVVHLLYDYWAVSRALGRPVQLGLMTCEAQQC